ncbi:carboxypeptidase Q isoform X1 [Tachyglossus aculeatus]|uniref:carboxypeptidase Q isoform X1 n=2 Tax=Tachyglossus aculeatus TaxID=9261 RepID=UPI0018F5D7D4|nr:carboxypeptidase Q isoform X1 [Tachyglossus aculeatus]
MLDIIRKETKNKTKSFSIKPRCIVWIPSVDAPAPATPALRFRPSISASSALVPSGHLRSTSQRTMKPVLFIVGAVHVLLLCFGNPVCKTHVSPKTFQGVKEEIARYADVAKAIINLAVHGKAQNRSYERLALLVDTVGPRLSGSKNLEKAIQIMYHNLVEDGLENVHLEPAKVPHWERGTEAAVMLEPRSHNIAMLGLGSSIGTPPEGITAEVLVVTSFAELQRRASEAKGKIVAYNQPYISYSESVQYRSRGAVEAAKVGAVASLIRSIASSSIYSPHTGQQTYQNGVPKIPTACITVEDAEMMARMASRGTRIVVHLKMEAKTFPDADSFNVVAEIVGSKYPDQVVLVSGHLDSWDVGQGAIDDGGGAFVSWEALSLIKDLGLRPKRTLRLVLWTAEEQGGVGSLKYYQTHKENVSNFNLVMESDQGNFLPTGLAFTGNEKARAIMKEVMNLLQPINITQVFEGGEGVDINYWIEAGVPGASLLDDLKKYFSFHHSYGDTMTAQDPVQMNLCAAVWSVVSYVVADLNEMLPR